MALRSWLAASAFLTLTLLLPLVGCNRDPVAGMTPAAPAAAPTPAVIMVPTSEPTSAPATPSPVPTGNAPGFSLPIGGDIPPLPPPPSAATAYAPASPAPLNAAPGGGIVPAAPPSAPLPNQPPQPQPSRPQPGNSPAPTPGAFTGGNGPAIHLSAGIAVPQSLPTGTAIGVSVDYELNGSLNRSSRYIWVIRSAAGEVVNEVKLDASGNLSAFFQQLKPEHRPFSARIEEVTPGSKRRVVVSNELPLKTDY